MRQLILAFLFVLIPSLVFAQQRYPASYNAVNIISPLCFRDITGATTTCLDGGTITCKRECHALGTAPTSLSATACDNTPAEIGTSNKIQLTVSASEASNDVCDYAITSSTTNAAEIVLSVSTKHAAIVDTSGKVSVASGGIVGASVTDGAFTSAKFAPDGTAQTGSTNTLTLASAESYADNALKDRIVCITLGTGKGECQVAASNVGSTDVVTFYNNWVITPDNTSQYVVVGSALANTNIWNGTAVPTGYTPGYPVVTIKDGTGAGELDTDAGGITSCGSTATSATRKW